MANNKIDRINKEIAKTREKITEYQNKLKGLEAQKTEAENLEIVQLVRAMRMTPQELNAMLSGGGIPGMSAAPASDAASAYEDQEDTADQESTSKHLNCPLCRSYPYGRFFCPCLCTGDSRRATRRGRDQ